MGVWSTSTPAGTDPISEGDDRIRELKEAVQESLRGGTTDGLEAVFPGAAPTTAPVFHYRGLKGTTAARPAATEGGLYFNTTTGTLQRADGSAWLDLTENAAYEAIHQVVGASLASSSGVVTLPETGNSFNVSGAEAVTSLAGWSAGVVIIKWVSSRVLTHHATNLILIDGINRTVAANDISVFEFTGSATVREIGRLSSQTPITKQYFITGSGTYTTPVNCKKLIVKMLGGGGGGGASETNSGSAGGDSSFNSITAAGGGGGGPYNGSDGAAGTGTGSASLRLPDFGGRDTLHGNWFNNVNGTNAPANSGRGGMPGSNYTNGRYGFSGAGGEFAEFTIANPASGATYSYAVGAGGGGASAGVQSGGNGGSGRVVVEEYY